LVPAAQQLISSSDNDNNNISTALLANHGCKAEWLESNTKIRTFVPDTETHSPRIFLPRTRGSGSTASAPVSDVFSPAYTNVVRPFPRLVSVAQKNRPLTMLFSTANSIDLPMGHGLMVLDHEAVE